MSQDWGFKNLSEWRRNSCNKIKEFQGSSLVWWVMYDSIEQRRNFFSTQIVPIKRWNPSIFNFVKCYYKFKLLCRQSIKMDLKYLIWREIVTKNSAGYCGFRQLFLHSFILFIPMTYHTKVEPWNSLMRAVTPLNRQVRKTTASARSYEFYYLIFFSSYTI